MFCTNCGKEIINTARFCNYCGSRVINLTPTPPPAPMPYTAQTAEQQIIPTAPEPPYKAPMSEQADNEIIQPAAADNTPSAISDAPLDDTSSDTPFQTANLTSENLGPNTSDQNTFISEPSFSTPIPESEILPQQNTPNEEASYLTDPYPTPGAIPKSGGSVSDAFSAPMGYIPPAPLIEPVSLVPEKRERKYTLGHILLCLASTAIMAITAGVFAGLYFSVV